MKSLKIFMLMFVILGSPSLFAMEQEREGQELKNLRTSSEILFKELVRRGKAPSVQSDNRMVEESLVDECLQKRRDLEHRYERGEIARPAYLQQDQDLASQIPEIQIAQKAQKTQLTDTALHAIITQFANYIFVSASQKRGVTLSAGALKPNALNSWEKIAYTISNITSHALNENNFRGCPR